MTAPTVSGEGREKETEGERENPHEGDARTDAREGGKRGSAGPRRSDKGRFADGTMKVVSDMSAEERYVARSQRFRKKLKSWMTQNVGRSWKTMSDLHRDAANYADCAMQTAARWIYQKTGPGQEFQIIELEDDYELALRGIDR